MDRNQFIKNAGLLSAGVLLKDLSFAQAPESFPVVRVPYDQRKFHSKAIDEAIAEFHGKVKNKELGWLFENCFPTRSIPR